MGVTHKITSASMTNLFPNAVEKPSISFSCNDVTGKFSFKITNVQVIQGDHVTPWPAPYQVAWLINSASFSPQPVALEQNATNGLYGAKASGVMTHIADCVTGIEIQVADWNNAASWTELLHGVRRNAQLRPVVGQKSISTNGRSSGLTLTSRKAGRSFS